MNRREQLQGQYEDALFALLMDEIATIEGQKAEEENRRLQNDPSAAVPEDLDRRCMQLIHRHFAKQKARAAGRFTIKAMKRVAMAVGVAAILFTTAFAASETVRVKTLNLMIEVFETNTEFRFSASSKDTALELNVGWLPDGYSLVEQGNNGFEIWYDYQNAKNDYLTINCEQTNGLIAGIDTENANVEYIQIQGSKAMLVKKGTESQLVWSVNQNSAFVGIVGSNISRTDMIHIANELQY